MERCWLTLIEKEARSGRWRQIKLSKNGPPITHED